MIRRWMRAPTGPAEVVADALRALAAIGIVVAGIGWGPLSGVSLALVTGAMFLPRLMGVRPAFDIAFGIASLVAVWSSVLDIYVTVRWWDLPVHFLTNGLWAALAYLLLVRLGVLADAATLPRPAVSAAVMTTALGLSFGVFWEMFEWFGHTFIDGEIYVGYTDSIGDLLVGGVGALLAGCGMAYLAAQPGAAEDRLPSVVE
ncbi:hypothetical protein J7E25_02115 [Agromyces sp. ISL-38]|uniref:hypothetical protein n=1 Tax=Agromyces sp. ISL-38 TaxID=2819107 RepID=UPI001BEBA5BF|nr:hypothetical protein [Agromyces sp. ISL-38]MBT2497882.1 hypothetical protein [Agromyces sp. ISL-38]MBT2517028.1 hypothetical protein [Streptomyces sp. ISL-90]